MGKRYRILVGVLLVAVVGGLAWQMSRPREPMYEGKPLSYWLLRPSLDRNLDAVRQTGTTAIPTLLQMLRAKDSVFFLKVVKLMKKQRFIKIDYVFAGERNFQAILGFGILGVKAGEAVPALVEIYDQAISSDSMCATADSLGAIGPLARPAVPSLLRGVTNKDENVRFGSLSALELIGPESSLLMPVLETSLKDNDWKVRNQAAHMLGGLGADAKHAVPAILPLLIDTQRMVRVAATNALIAIDPEAAAKAGVQ
ncbi:MAG: repeat protein [Pedosphaera sp.]|nr:repeat protein [Pedosphaera sp.]